MLRSSVNDVAVPHAQLNLQQPTDDKVKMTPPHVGACGCGLRVQLKQGRVDAQPRERFAGRRHIQRDGDANVSGHRTERHTRGAWQ